MMLTTEQINEAVQSALPDVLAGLRKEITESALMTAKRTLHDEITKAVTEWVKTEIVPEIHATLVESKDGLVSMAPKLGQQLVAEISASLHLHLKDKLEKSWSRGDVFKALFT